MSYQAINDTIIKQLKTIDSLPRLYQENEDGYLDSTARKGQRGSVYCRTTLQTAEKVTKSIGDNGSDKLMGYMQVDLFYTKGKGTSSARDMAQLIIDAFPQKSALDAGDFHVHILKAYSNTGVTTNNHYMLSVDIQWEAFISR